MIKEYFSFTLKERIAIFTLVALILGIYFLPQFISVEHKKPTAQELEDFRRAERALAESNKNVENNYHSKQRGNGMDHAPPFTSDESKPSRLFYFDPNTLDASGWKQLGLREKTIGTIHKYISKGGRFKHPGDLKKIFGLRPDEYQRLETYVRIEMNNDRVEVVYDKFQPAANNYVSASDKLPFRATTKKLQVININTADTTALIELPGIGSKLAARILNFRDKLGGFYDIEQVKETYGLPDSTFQKIRPWLAADVSQVRKININTVTPDELKLHPYIRWNLAAALIKYREQHGPFTALQQLQQLGAWTAETYNKVLPYLKLD